MFGKEVFQEEENLLRSIIRSIDKRPHSSLGYISRYRNDWSKTKIQATILITEFSTEPKLVKGHNETAPKQPLLFAT